MDTSNVKAFIFDVFGTVVDWRTSITLQCEKFGETKGIQRDWKDSLPEKLIQELEMNFSKEMKEIGYL